jgi:hypothetical protein
MMATANEIQYHTPTVGGRNPCGVESSFDTKLSGKQIKNATICYPKYESLICLIKSMNSICLEIYKWKAQFPCKQGKLAGSSTGHRDCIHLCCTTSLKIVEDLAVQLAFVMALNSPSIPFLIS